jgi:hypothetical protein
MEEEILEKKPNRQRKNHKQVRKEQGIKQLGSRCFIKFPSLADGDAISLWRYEEVDEKYVIYQGTRRE